MKFLPGILVLVPFMLIGQLAMSQEAAAFTEDVTYLLNQCETQAGDLLRKKGIDWAAVRAEFTNEAENATTDDQKYKLVSRLLSRLQDGHAGIMETTCKPADEARGRRFTGPRVQLVTSGNKVLVRSAFKDAAEAGLKAGQEVLTLDGTPARAWLDNQIPVMQARGSSFSTPHQALYAACHWGLADWEGTTIAFEVKLPDGTTKVIKRVRNGGPNFAPYGPLFPPANLQYLGRQSYGVTKEGLGYIHLRDIPGTLPDQLDQMLKELGNVPGLILDMRANGGGGCDHRAVFGRFLVKGKAWGSYEGLSDTPYTGPVVVIIDAGVRSAGETVSGMLKEDGRAYVIGDSPTAGTSSQKTEVKTPSGSFKVRFSVRSNMARFNKGKGIEGIGVPPHEVVPVQAADLLKDEDTLIKRATELLRRGFPAGVVDYPGR
ncbi:MAG: S41 family peptidase [Verrucomicrobium sp.]|nr:S41 family peptidase [Verrucomicrobium sp.]